MNDKELSKMFGMSLDEVEREVGRIEAGDYSGYDFSHIIQGFPLQKEPQKVVSTPVGVSRLAAITRVTEQQGISRSEFIRRAIDHELLALS